MLVVIGSDHAGYLLKEEVIKYLNEKESTAQYNFRMTVDKGGCPDPDPRKSLNEIFNKKKQMKKYKKKKSKK